MVLGIREALVTSAGAGELGVEVYGVSDIADDQKRRATVAGGDGSDVIAALVIGAFKGLVEGGAAPAAVAGFGGSRCFIGPAVIGRRYRRFRCALFGLADEVSGFVEIDVVRDGRAIRIHPWHGAVKDIEILFRIGRSGIRPWDLQEIAEFSEEHLIVRPLGRAGVFPAGDERCDFLWQDRGHWLPSD